MAEFIRIEGLKELEGRLKQLRDEFGTETGGVILRGLQAGMDIVKDDARGRAPIFDPSGFTRERRARIALLRAGKLKGTPGRKMIRTSLAVIKNNIVAYKIPAKSKIAGGMPTVIMRVRARGYDRYEIPNGRKHGPRSPIHFRNPTVSPGYWWWVEFGTSRLPAKPFLRPAFQARKGHALEELRKTVKAEIEKIIREKGVRR